MATLAFYVAKNGNFVDKAIAWYTKSKFSHVELIVDGYWYSTSPRDLKVRKKQISPTDGNWEYVQVEIDKDYVEEFFTLTQGKKYDWLGIALSQFLPFKTHDKGRWFCSEWCATALKIEDASEYSPQDLYKKITV